MLLSAGLAASFAYFTLTPLHPPLQTGAAIMDVRQNSSSHGRPASGAASIAWGLSRHVLIVSDRGRSQDPVERGFQSESMVRKARLRRAASPHPLIVHTWFGWLPASSRLVGRDGAHPGRDRERDGRAARLIGRAGIAVGAILTMFVGNLLSSPGAAQGARWAVVGVALSLIGRHRDEGGRPPRGHGRARSCLAGARPPVALSPHRHPLPL